MNSFTKQFNEYYTRIGFKSEADAAKALYTSIPTIKCWLSGRSTPHKLAQDSVLCLLHVIAHHQA